MKKYVGLSLSFCVKDILEGFVLEEQVAFIVPGFNWTGTPHESYYGVYWRKFDRQVADELLSRLKTVPRPAECDAPNLANGMWWPEDKFDWSVLADPDKRVRTEVLTAEKDVALAAPSLQLVQCDEFGPATKTEVLQNGWREP
jgi:hypothetical protein